MSQNLSEVMVPLGRLDQYIILSVTVLESMKTLVIGRSTLRFRQRRGGHCILERTSVDSKGWKPVLNKDAQMLCRKDGEVFWL